MMLKRRFSFFAIVLFSNLIVSCTTVTSDNNFAWQEIQGRDDGNAPYAREAIYRAKVPQTWNRVMIPTETSNADTKLPIAEFTIGQEEEVTVWVHNFPYDNLEERIPIPAQVSRWERQFSFIEPTSLSVEPYAHGGFAGKIFQAKGTLRGVPDKAVIAVAMQLAAQHFRLLQSSGPKLRQMRGDYTIKAVGPKNLIDKYREEIMIFSRSFELIDEIPPRS